MKYIKGGVLLEKLFLILLLTILFQMKSNTAYAYIDPGSGSYILQILIASFLGLIFTFKTFFRRFFSRKKRTDFSELNSSDESEMNSVVNNTDTETDQSPPK
jgi:hypothetical protein